MYGMVLFMLTFNSRDFENDEKNDEKCLKIF